MIRACGACATVCDVPVAGCYANLCPECQRPVREAVRRRMLARDRRKKAAKRQRVRTVVVVPLKLLLKEAQAEPVAARDPIDTLWRITADTPLIASFGLVCGRFEESRIAA